MARKTFKVEDFKIMINHKLKFSPDRAIEYRQGLLISIENVLMQSGNYKGFNYLTIEQIKEYGNKVPGIWRPDPEQPSKVSFENTDNTRVFFY